VNAITGSFSTEARYYVYNYDGTVVADAKSYTSNDTNYYATYGVLYNWTAAMAGAASSNANPSGVKGVCPTGWHLPSSVEWTTLETYVGGDITAGTRLKSVSGWNIEGDTETDSYGFSALPAGYYLGTGFGSALKRGYWWTSVYAGPSLSYRRFIDAYDAKVFSDYLNNNFGFSVRCVQD